MKAAELENRNLVANAAALAGLGVTLPDAQHVAADGGLEITGGRTVGVFLSGPGGRLRMHSARNPLGEAQALLERPLQRGLAVVVGAGAGYLLDALDVEGHSGTVLLLEPSPASLMATLRRRDWSQSLAAGRLRILPGPEYAGWPELAPWLGSMPSPPAVLIHPVLARERPAAVREALEVAKRLIFSARANDGARRAFAWPYLRNTLCNLALLEHSGDAGRLEGGFRGIPACVLAAGPSLNRNLEVLRPRRDGLLVITVDTALRTCLAEGIEPDLVVAVDPGQANVRHLQVERLPERTWLVAEPSIAPGSFDAFEGRVFTFRVDRHDPWPWLQAHGLDRARLLAWGSVLLTALDLAERLGCHPIALAGVDFAYTDGQPYCRGTVHEEDWQRLVDAGARLEDVWKGMQRQPVIVERAIDGQPVETSSVLLAFRDRIEHHCRSRPAGTFLNLTARGLLRGLDADVSDVPCVRHDAARVMRAASGPVGASTPLLDAALAALRADNEEPWAAWSRATGVPMRALVDAVATAAPNAAAFEAAYMTRRAGRWGYSSTGMPAPSREDPRPPVPVAIHEVTIPPDFLDFRTERWQRINRRRLEHLASLHLPIAGRTVVELGAGIGDLTDFFLDRGCSVTSVDGRAEMLDVMSARFAGHLNLSLVQMNLDPPERPLGEFDVVHCYGVLYLLSDPVPLLDWMASSCNDLMLLETIVLDEDRAGPVATRWQPLHPAGPLGPHGSVPPRRWLWDQLASRFPYVYAPAFPPAHAQFPLAWDDASRGGVTRAVYIGSRRPRTSHTLVDTLPARQPFDGSGPGTRQEGPAR